MIASFIAELDKLIRRPATWALGAVWVAMAIVFGYVIPYSIYVSNQAPLQAYQLLPEQLSNNVLAGFPLFGVAIALIVGALATGGEFGWGTLGPILVQRPVRLNVLAGKLLAVVVVLLGFVVAVFFLDAVSSYVVTSIESAPVNWPSPWDLAQALGAGWFIFIAGGALGTVLATIFRDTTLAVGLGLVYVLVIEGLLSGFAGQSETIANVAKGLPGPNAASIVAALAPASTGTDTPGMVAVVGGGQATFVLAAYTIAFLLIAALLFYRRDVH